MGIANNSIVCNLKDRRVLIPINRYNELRIEHPYYMLQGIRCFPWRLVLTEREKHSLAELMQSPKLRLFGRSLRGLQEIDIFLLEDSGKGVFKVKKAHISLISLGRNSFPLDEIHPKCGPQSVSSRRNLYREDEILGYSSALIVLHRGNLFRGNETRKI